MSASSTSFSSTHQPGPNGRERARLRNLAKHLSGQAIIWLAAINARHGDSLETVEKVTQLVDQIVDAELMLADAKQAAKSPLSSVRGG